MAKNGNLSELNEVYSQIDSNLTYKESFSENQEHLSSSVSKNYKEVVQVENSNISSKQSIKIGESFQQMSSNISISINKGRKKILTSNVKFYESKNSSKLPSTTNKDREYNKFQKIIQPKVESNLREDISLEENNKNLENNEEYQKDLERNNKNLEESDKNHDQNDKNLEENENNDKEIENQNNVNNVFEEEKVDYGDQAMMSRDFKNDEMEENLKPKIKTY